MTAQHCLGLVGNWRIALGKVKKCVIGEVCFDKDNIINCTKICLFNSSGGFWVIFVYYLEEAPLAMSAQFPSHIGDAECSVLKMVVKIQCSAH